MTYTIPPWPPPLAVFLSGFLMIPQSVQMLLHIVGRSDRITGCFTQASRIKGVRGARDGATSTSLLFYAHIILLNLVCNAFWILNVRPCLSQRIRPSSQLQPIQTLCKAWLSLFFWHDKKVNPHTGNTESLDSADSSTATKKNQKGLDCHLSITASTTATYPTPAYSPTVYNRLVAKTLKPKIIFKQTNKLFKRLRRRKNQLLVSQYYR